jgi:chromosome segregation ATPase
LILGLLVAVASEPIHSATAEEGKTASQPTSAAKKSNAAAVRVPHTLSAELEKDRQVIETEKATAAEINMQLQSAKQSLDTEAAAVASQEASVEAMRKDIDATQRRIVTTDTIEVQRFNRRVKEFNVLASEAIEKRTDLNASIEQYNELAKKSQTQVTLVNQLAEAYNAKLLRNGHADKK